MNTESEGDGVIRNFAAKYAIIYANEYYDQLRTLERSMSDLKWTKNDLINARPTVEMFGIPRENVYELIDCTYDQVQTVNKELKSRVHKHAEAGESVFVYAYAAGHGLGGVR